jgi:hypothetical protein
LQPALNQTCHLNTRVWLMLSTLNTWMIFTRAFEALFF